MNPADSADILVGHPAGGDDPTMESAARRAARLLRWYPRPWRLRYGEEFTELLVADITERPGAPGRALDVVRAGIVARLAGAGLAGFQLAEAAGGAGDRTAARIRHVTASLGSLVAAIAAFCILGAAQWSQILVSWVWTMRLRAPLRGNWPADFRADRSITMGTSAAIIAFLALGVLAAIPVVVTVAARLRAPRFEGQRKRLAWPTMTLAAALIVLVIGGRALENNWIGTGGLHSPVPGGLAAFIWSVTLFDSAYWAHPALFSALPEAERIWMAVSPVVLAVAVASVVVLVRHTALSPRVARFEVRLGLVACPIMAGFLVACGGWLAYDGPSVSRLSLFHAGWINVASTGLLALALAAGLQAARIAMRGLRQASR